MCSFVDHLLLFLVRSPRLQGGVRGARDDVRHLTHRWLLSVESPLQLLMCLPSHPTVEPRGFEPRTSAVQRRRSPG
jgi:hypothetical protein